MDMARKEGTLKLIDLYKGIGECLWNQESGDFANSDARSEAWAKISDELKNVEGFGTEESVQKKIKNLRASYAKELLRVEASARRAAKGGGGEPYVPNTYWYEKLDSFLKPHVNKERKRQRSISNNLRQIRRQSTKPAAAVVHEGNDEFDAFGTLVASHLKRLPMTDALRLEKQITDSLYEERFKLLSLKSGFKSDKEGEKVSDFNYYDETNSE